LIERPNRARDRLILVAGIDGDGVQPPQIPDVLIDHGERRFGRPLGDNGRLKLLAFIGKIEEQRGVINRELR
jgi:hypothetical protein